MDYDKSLYTTYSRNREISPATIELGMTALRAVLRPNFDGEHPDDIAEQLTILDYDVE